MLTMLPCVAQAKLSLRPVGCGDCDTAVELALHKDGQQPQKQQGGGAAPQPLSMLQSAEAATAAEAHAITSAVMGDLLGAPLQTLTMPSHINVSLLLACFSPNSVSSAKCVCILPVLAMFFVVQ